MAAADRREAILAAALDAFAGGGYHETSLEDVAERAGISKALIYEHFPSKRDLHGALLETYVRELLATVVEAHRRGRAGRGSACAPASTASSPSSRSAATPGGCSSATSPSPTSPTRSSACGARRRGRSPR